MSAHASQIASEVFLAPPALLFPFFLSFYFFLNVAALHDAEGFTPTFSDGAKRLEFNIPFSAAVTKASSTGVENTSLFAAWRGFKIKSCIERPCFLSGKDASAVNHKRHDDVAAAAAAVAHNSHAITADTGASGAGEQRRRSWLHVNFEAHHIARTSGATTSGGAFSTRSSLRLYCLSFFFSESEK